MKKSYDSVRIIFGLILLFFGANGFFQFLPPPEFNEAGSAFIAALFATGYVFPIMSSVFLLAGISFVVNHYAALLAVVLVPISANLLLFHFSLDPKDMIFALVIAALNLYMLWMNRKKYALMLKVK